MSDYPPPPPPQFHSNVPEYSQGSMTENAVNNQPPSYGFVNPQVFNNSNDPQRISPPQFNSNVPEYPEHPIRENTVNNQPPSYGFVNPQVFNNPNDPLSKPVQNDVNNQVPTSGYGFVNPQGLYNPNDPSQSKPVQNQPQWIPPPSTPGFVGGTPNIFTTSPGINPVSADVETYQVWSILNIFFCCLCLGLLACFYSNEVNNLKIRGDIQGALSASRNARTINIIATVLGVVLNVIYVLAYTQTI